MEVCGDCLLHPPDLDACVAAVSYGYPWAQAIKALKFQEDPGWAATLATLLHRAPAVQVAIAQADEVLCVPLSRQRLRERGFNQSALIAHALAPEKANPHALLRLHDTAAQSGLNRSQRLNNLRNAFMVEPNISPQLTGKRVIVVDDVMTTGATLNAIAATLRAAGVEHITAMVIARTERD